MSRRHWARGRTTQKFAGAKRICSIWRAGGTWLPPTTPRDTFLRMAGTGQGQNTVGWLMLDCLHPQELDEWLVLSWTVLLTCPMVSHVNSTEGRG